MDKPLKVLFIAPECAPFAKVGGLADVVGALPKALARRGHAVRVVIPLYRETAAHLPQDAGRRPLRVPLGPRAGGDADVGLAQARLAPDVPVCFVDHPVYGDRPFIYGPPGADYGDNVYRFSLLCRAALQLCAEDGNRPDIVHCHDWTTAMIPAVLKLRNGNGAALAGAATVLTIHNIGYQGVYPAADLPQTGLGYEHLTPWEFEYYGKLNLLKGGIRYADRINTVSPTHLREILEHPDGMGLAADLAARRYALRGILNGIDDETWNPAADPLLPAVYTADEPAGKTVCKAALQEQSGLAVDSRVPLFGIVSRLVRPKGVELLRDALPGVLRDMDVQLAVLGSGDADIESFFRDLETAWPGRVSAHIGFSNPLSHRIEAGSDFFLMPSLYEPCGLNQMYSLRYGALPVVRAVGGLADAVENYDERRGTGTGFMFHDATPEALYNTIGWAVSTWHDRPAHIRALRRAGMGKDFSWRHAAGDYERLYRDALSSSALKRCGRRWTRAGRRRNGGCRY